MRDPKFTSVFDSNSLLCVILFELVWFKSICLYSFQKELDLTLTITVLPQFTCSEKSCHQEILARALHLVCSSLKELSSCVLWVSCTLSRILYKLHNFFLWEECMEKKKLEIKHSLGPETCALQNYALTWKVGDEWSLNDSFFITWVNDLYVYVIQVKLEIYNVSWFVCIHYEWMIFFFISTGTYLLVKTVNQE